MEMRRLSHARQREAVEFLDAKGGVGEVTRANATLAGFHFGDPSRMGKRCRTAFLS